MQQVEEMQEFSVLIHVSIQLISHKPREDEMNCQNLYDLLSGAVSRGRKMGSKNPTIG